MLYEQAAIIFVIFPVPQKYIENFNAKSLAPKVSYLIISSIPPQLIRSNIFLKRRPLFVNNMLAFAFIIRVMVVL